MTVSISEYNKNINILLQNNNSDNKAVELAFDICRSRIQEEKKQLLKEIYAAPFDVHTIHEKCRDWEKKAAKLNQFFQSNLSKSTFGSKFEYKGKPKLDWEKEMLADYQREIHLSLTLRESIELLLSTDASFRNSWSPDLQKEIMSLILEAYTGFVKRNAIKVKTPLDDVFTKTVQVSLKWVPLMKKYECKRFSKLFSIFFESYATSTPEKAEQVIDFLFELIGTCKSANPKKALDNLLFIGMDKDLFWPKTKPWTAENIERRLKILKKADQLLNPEEGFSIFHIESIWLSEKHENFYDNHPDVLCRLVKIGYPPAYLFYCEENVIRQLLDLFEAISPSDTKYLIEPLFLRKIKLTPTRAQKLISLLTWMRDNIETDSSNKNKKHISGFADRVIALMWDNPQLADDILSIRNKQYQHVCDLLNSKHILEGLTSKDFGALFQKNKIRLAKTASESLNDGLYQEILDNFLNTVLKLHNTSSKGCLMSKLEQLPKHYLQAIQKMIVLTENDPKCIEQFFIFAHAFPYSMTLHRYIENFKYVKKDSMLSTMTNFNTLTRENPELLPQLLSCLGESDALIQLKEIDPDLYHTLIEKHADIIFSDPINLLLKKENLRTHLTSLLDVEEKQNISLVPILLLLPKALFNLKNKLIKAISKNPKFARQLSRLLWNQNHLFIWNLDILNLLNKNLKTKSKTIFDLFNLTSQSPNILYKFLKAAILNDSFFTYDVSENDPIQTLYHQLIDFNDTYPTYTSELLSLLDNKQDDIMSQILSCSKIRPHIPKLMELLRALQFDEVESFLANPDKPLPILGPGSPSVCQMSHIDELKADLEIFVQNEQNSKASRSIKRGFQRKAKDKKWAAKARFLLACDTELAENYKKSGSIKKFVEGRFQYVLETTLVSFMDKSDLRAIDKKKLTAAQRKNFTLGIGKALITLNGTLNIDLIEEIQASTVYRKLKSTQTLKAYLDCTLETLKTHAEFGEIIKKMPQPPAASHFVQLIKKMIKTEEVTAQTARIVITATILSPVRQKIGSCFATSVVIQAASHPDGLLQKLDDYLSLLTNDYLERENIRFPMLYNIEDFSREFAGENLLSRAYELIVAMMAGHNTDSSLKASTLRKWRSIFMKQIQQHYADLLENRDICNLETDTLLNLRSCLNQACRMIYSGHAKHKYTGELGAWLLLDSKTLKPLNKSKKTVNRFYTRIFKQMKKKLIEKYPEHSAAFSEIFDKRLPEYINSNKFAKDFYKNNHDDKGLPKLIPSKYHHLQNKTPLVKYEGGDSFDLAKIYHGKSVVKTRLPYGANPFYILEAFVKNLSSAEKESINKNPSALMTISNKKDHCFNLKLNNIMQIVKQGPETLTKKLTDAAETLAQVQLTDKQARKIIDDYTTWQKYPDKKTRNLHKELLLKHHKNNTCLQDLCDKIVATDRLLTGMNRPSVGKVMDWAIRSQSSFSGKLPPIYIFADMNWESSHNLGLSCYVHDRSIQTLLTTSSGKFRKIFWSPGPMSKWEVYRFPKKLQHQIIS